MSAVKTILGTGCSSGIGFEVIKQLLGGQQSYRFILGCRDANGVKTAFESLKYDQSKHSVETIPLNLSDLRTVRSFASEALSQLQGTKLDYVLLNAGMTKAATEPGVNGSKWCESYVVNHLSQHYLVHLVKEKLIESQGRLAVVTSGAIRGDKDTSEFESILKANSGTDAFKVYTSSKTVQWLGTEWWRRHLPASVKVIGVSPGLIPGTGLGRHSDLKLTVDMPDAKTIPEGARSVINALERNDFPEDPRQMVLASWGEWWPADTYDSTFDEKLQDLFSPSKEQIEEEERVR